MTVLFVLAVTGDCAQVEGGALGHSDCGVGLGQHGAHCCPGQHVSPGRGRQVWTAEHWGPDHVCQRHQSRWAATVQLSDIHEGEGRYEGVQGMEV